MERVGNAAQSGRESATVGVAQLLEEARKGIRRFPPEEAHAAALAGAVLVDIRSDTQRLEDGEIACATPIPRSSICRSAAMAGRVPRPGVRATTS